MKLIFTNAILWILLALNFQLGLFLSTNSYEIRDLEGTNACFLSEITNWSTSRQKTSNIYNLCGGKFILGGFDILGTLASPAWYGDYFSRTYSGLSTHTMIYFTMTLWAIDTWGYGPYWNDTFALEFDTTKLSGPYLKYLEFPTEICGLNGKQDLGPIRIIGKVLHSANTLNLKIIHMLDEDTSNESIGFRDINLLFVNAAASPPDSMCLTGSIAIPSNMTCDCPEGQFKKGATCLSCHPSCASCFGFTEAECYQCAPGNSFVNGKCIACDASCNLCRGPAPTDCVTCQPGLFLLGNNTCIPECTSPSISSTDGCVNYCSSPCNSDFLWWDGTCQTTCPYPLQQITTLTSIKKCLYPCKTGEYLYWDGTCKPNCDYPLTVNIQYGVQYCQYSCALDKFLYWDQSCNSTCDPPLVQAFDKDRQFCIFPCTSEEFLNHDGSCITSCTSPFYSTTFASNKFCHHPCPSPSYFVYWDNTCQSSCLTPRKNFKVGTITYCTYVCPTGQYLLWNGNCISSCEPPLTIENRYYGDACLLPCSNPLDYYYEETNECKSFCNSYSVVERDLYFKCLPTPPPVRSGLLVDLLLIAPSNPGTFTFIVLSKLTQYLRYLDVNFPPRLKTLILSQGRSVLSIRLGMRMHVNMQNSFSKHSLPSVFQQKNLHSSFMVNYWQEMTSLWIALGIVFMIILITFISKKMELKTMENICRSIAFIFMWNYPLILIATSIDDIILFSALEFQTFQGESGLPVLSLIYCLFMLLIIVFLFVGCIYLSSKARSLQQNRNLQSAHQSFLLKWQSCQVLFRDYKNARGINHLFYLIYVLRLALQMIITVSCHSMPLLQVIIYMILSVLMIIYIVWMKPIKSTINHIQILIIETIVLTINICVTVLIGSKNEGSFYEESVIFVGDVIILGNVLYNLVLVAFLVAKIFIAIKEALRLKKQESNKEKAAWAYLLFLPIQQGGMGFEEFELFEPSNMDVVSHDHTMLLQQSTRKEFNIYDNSQLSSERALFESTRDDKNAEKELVNLSNYSRQMKGIEPAKKKLGQASERSLTEIRDISKRDNKGLESIDEEVVVFTEGDEQANEDRNHKDILTSNQEAIFNAFVIPKTRQKDLTSFTMKPEDDIMSKRPLSPIHSNDTITIRSIKETEHRGKAVEENYEGNFIQAERAGNRNETTAQHQMSMDMASTLRSDRSLLNVVETLGKRKKSFQDL